jgi:hypothetical protein
MRTEEDFARFMSAVANGNFDAEEEHPDVLKNDFSSSPPRRLTFAEIASTGRDFQG